MPNIKSLAIIAAFVVGVSAVGYTYFTTIAGGATGPDPDNPTIVAQGKDLYAATCAECHGADLKGQPDWKTRNEDGSLKAPPHDVSGHTWHHADALLFQVTKHGGASIAPAGFISAMPAFKDALSDDEIWAVLSFIKSTWPKKIRQRQESLSQQNG